MCLLYFVIMNPKHAKILTELKKKPARKNNKYYAESYTGSNRKSYLVSVPDLRSILKDWLKKNPGVSTDEIFSVVDSLMFGESHEEKMMGSYLLGYRKDVQQIVETSHLDKWLDEMVGWAEIDALCQNIFNAEQLLAKWSAWKTFLTDLAKSPNINKRRASLVFLVGPTWKCDDVRLHKIAYANIEKLKFEKNILITKAISWLLRCMIMSRENETKKYLESNCDSLPKIAVRETRSKLLKMNMKQS